MERPGDARGNVVLREAGVEAVPALRRLMQLYLYDLGSLDGWRIGADGLYGDAERIERFWTEPGRRAFLLEVEGEIAGFALIRDEAELAGPGTHEVSEFFVLRKFRRRGVGERAATVLFDMAPGPWELTQLASNVPAQEFWRRVIARYPGDGFREPGHGDGRARPRRVHRFTAPAGGPRS
jgi:predicted acetyltransferase